jgi:hypothetical protein
VAWRRLANSSLALNLKFAKFGLNFWRRIPSEVLRSLSFLVLAALHLIFSLRNSCTWKANHLIYSSETVSSDDLKSQKQLSFAHTSIAI